VNRYLRCYAEISLEAIGHNIREVKKRLPEGVKLLGVVKANAYGHGAVPVASYLENQVDYFATATIEEAVELRENGISAPILILGYVSPSQYGDLVEYGRFPYRSALSGLGEKDREIIQWALASTGMSSLEHREMERLSGGQQQRAWIAMALAQKTGLLFLDEPTTYLDISHQLDILYLLRRLNRENGVTIVMVLHDLNHAIMFSDYLVAIKDGMLHSAGTPQEVITQQALREIFDVEAEVITHPVLNIPVCLPFRITEQNKKTGGSNT